MNISKRLLYHDPDLQIFYFYFLTFFSYNRIHLQILIKKTLLQIEKHGRSRIKILDLYHNSRD